MKIMVFLLMLLWSCSGEEGFQKEIRPELETILRQVENSKVKLLKAELDYDEKYKAATNLSDCPSGWPRRDECLADRMEKGAAVGKESLETFEKLRKDIRKLRESFLALEDRIKKRYGGALPDWVQDNRDWRALDKQFQQ